MDKFENHGKRHSPGCQDGMSNEGSEESLTLEIIQADSLSLHASQRTGICSGK